MKRITYLFILSVLFGAVWMACDKIDEPLPLINEEDIPQDITDTLFFADSVDVMRKQVLLEDFTGHKCPNCPEWGIFAHDMAEAVDHKLVIMALHGAQWYSEPDATGLYTADLRCEAAIELVDAFGILGLPTGLIDRTDYGTQINPNNWESIINEQLALDPVVGIKLKNTYYPNLNSVIIDVETDVFADLPGNFKLCVYLTENHFVSPQQNNNPEIGPSPDWVDYENNSLVREAINTTYGEHITSTGEIVNGETYSSQFIYNINEEWVTENCNIVVYLYNEETWDVVQVAELGIKTE